MADYSSSSTYALSRDVTIVDTNVLLAAFWPDDSRHEDTKTFLFEIATSVIIPVPVLVETWGILVGRSKRWDCGLKLLAWIVNPGSCVTVIDRSEPVGGVQALIESAHIDCVDAYIAHLADDVTEICDFDPPIRVATYDTGDFVLCRVNHHIRLRVWDLNSLDVY